MIRALGVKGRHWLDWEGRGFGIVSADGRFRQRFTKSQLFQLLSKALQLLWKGWKIFLLGSCAMVGKETYRGFINATLYPCTGDAYARHQLHKLTPEETFNPVHEFFENPKNNVEAISYST